MVQFSKEYMQSPINQKASTYGIKQLLIKMGFGEFGEPKKIILTGIVAVLITLVAICVGGSDRLQELLLLAGSIGMLAIKFKRYDLAVIMAAMMLTGCMARRLILAPALVFLWRQEVSSKAF